MSVKATWDNDKKTIAILTFEGKWTWEEYEGGFESLMQLLDTVSHPVGYIIDMRNSSILPERVLANIKTTAQAPHNNWNGNAVVVGSNVMVEGIVNLIGRLWGRGRQHYHFARSLDDARDILN